MKALMTANASTTVRKPLLSLRAALWIVLLFWLLHAAIYGAQPGNNPLAFLEFIPGILGVLILLLAGFSLQRCYLQPAALSRKGALWLEASLLLTPILWLTGRWVGWDSMGALVYAPASGISQELFFRGALLPVLLATLPGRATLAIILHALLFSAWHIPRVAMTSPIGGIISVVAFTFVVGILWARQVQQDKTVFWLMAFHSTILFINSFFTWG